MSGNFVASSAQFFVNRRVVDGDGTNDGDVHTYSRDAVKSQVFQPDSKTHNRKLVAFQAKNETEVNNIQQKEKEAIDDYMDRLQHRLTLACIDKKPLNPSHPEKEPRKQHRKSTGNISQHGQERTRSQRKKLDEGGKAVNNESRWKSATNLSEKAAQYLTDSDYLDQLQGNMQKESLFSLQSRLLERQVKKDGAPHLKGKGKKSSGQTKLTSCS